MPCSTVCDTSISLYSRSITNSRFGHRLASLYQDLKTRRHSTGENHLARTRRQCHFIRLSLCVVESILQLIEQSSIQEKLGLRSEVDQCPSELLANRLDLRPVDGCRQVILAWINQQILDKSVT